MLNDDRWRRVPDRDAHERARAYASSVADPASSLGEFIRRQRELSEMSMREFARLAGISNPYLSQIERGLRAPSEHVMQAIANTLKVSADTLYQQAGVPPADDGPSKVIEAIREDARLTGRQRQALIQVYDAFAATSPRAQRSRRSSA
jgi:transcriptional regulator with XRE-family HTH domain